MGKFGDYTEDTTPTASDTVLVKQGANTFQVKLENLGIGDKIMIPLIIDGGGAVLTTGVKADIGPFPFACTITQVTMLADVSGSVVVDIWKDSYANFAPTDADSITASAVPTITTAIKSQDSTLTGWTTSIAVGDILRFNVDSATTITRVTMTLDAVKA